ncbi:putative short-chain dehydrogenase/reductase family 42E member 2 [Hemicordylus capensis]|uniref:putative short-chain dehydrogenase/reductase family 42E member 2 n=1 Tax=Hemicordylus capensis TaxID=884348 RepID=UPI0023020429|nr:putative short-chain dehydrogenase/reductase family 42E member 2 [Hemicordylus capensis]XP_053133141.1 putative short-chain dehydrogenase/reductase family 42E member 2 [Hemicordylus capensis]
MEKPPRKERKAHLFSKPSTRPAVILPDSSQPGRKKVSDKTVVTGGAGYFGFTLGRALAKSGTSVIIYDIQKPLWEVPPGVVFIQADVRHYEDFYTACEGADCVIHAAAYGMTGIEQLRRKRIASVNVGGTSVVIEVCKQQNVPRLIYTSSINVVFSGQPIIDGDEESVPYFPLDKQVNEYSKTKTIAEQMVLAANGTSLAGGGRLYTCALRPPGIYGPEEQRHLPRLALNTERGLFLTRIGDPKNLMTWVHVKNLVQAHILAADALTPEKNYIAAGQAYFINDGEKVNLFEWLAPLFERLGFRKPRIRVPIFGAYLTAVLGEYLHQIMRPFVEITPLITRNEVNNFRCTHTFKIDKARSQLGYQPKKYEFADCVDHYLKSRPRKRNFFLLKCFLCFLLFVGLVILAVRYEEVRVFLAGLWIKYHYLIE